MTHDEEKAKPRVWLIVSLASAVVVLIAALTVLAVLHFRQYYSFEVKGIFQQ